jgi:hypothetical protein
MADYNFDEIETCLAFILCQMEQQHQLASTYPEEMMSFTDQMAQIREYIEVAGEYGLAYELMVINLENHPFQLTGSAAVKLLELALIMKFKTDRSEDKIFDLR